MRKQRHFRPVLRSLILTLFLMVTFAMPAMAGEWVAEEDGHWTYYNEEGESVTGWIREDGDTYYLSRDGERVTGWYKIKGSWYYFDEDGLMAADTWIDNYYVNSQGKLRKTR